MNKQISLYQRVFLTGLSGVIAMFIFGTATAGAANLNTGAAQLDIAGVQAGWSQPGGATVAVLDSAVRDGPELSGRLQQGTACDGTNTNDPKHHGEAIANIVGAADNNNGITGISPTADIVAYNITVNGQARSDCLVNAIIDAADRGIRIINVSFATADLGNDTVRSQLQAAITHARSAGAIVVASAGNWQGAVGEPARWPQTLAVSADGFASGPSVAVWGPASGYTATDSQGNELADVNAGTSLAAAATSGVLSKILGANPGLSVEQAIAAVNGQLNERQAFTNIGVQLAADKTVDDDSEDVALPSAALAATKLSHLRLRLSGRTLRVAWHGPSSQYKITVQVAHRRWRFYTRSKTLRVIMQKMARQQVTVTVQKTGSSTLLRRHIRFN